MKKTLSLLILLATFTIANAQLLWKVSGKGLSKPSYIVGTYHFAPASFTDSIAGLRNVLDDCDQVYGEITTSVMNTPDYVTKTMEASMLPDSIDFKSLFTTEQIDRINAFLREFIGGDMTNPIIEAQFRKAKPAIVTTQLTAILYMKHHPVFNPQNLLDSYLQDYATEKGKTTGGLESLDFQLDMLFNKTPLKRQAEQLLCLIDNADFNNKQVENILDAYFSQNLDKIKEAINLKLNSSCDATPEEENRLIYDRNANWVAMLPFIMKQGCTLVAVGAGHLPGDKGLLQLLRNEGFTVTPVK